MLVAQAQLPAGTEDAKVTTGILASQAAGQQGTRQKEPGVVESARVEGSDTLGMLDPGFGEA